VRIGNTLRKLFKRYTTSQIKVRSANRSGTWQPASTHAGRDVPADGWKQTTAAKGKI